MTDELEGRISRALESFAIAGLALKDIRDKELWRDSYDNFNQYVAKRWAITPGRAEWLISAGVCQNALYWNIGPDKALPMNEAQITPLLDLPEPEQQVEAWKEALANTHGGKPAPDVVRQAVNTRQTQEGEWAEDETGSEIRSDFLARLDMVADLSYYSVRRLTKLFECSELEVDMFVAMCEVSPAVTVHRKERGDKTFYAFEPTDCILGRDRVMQLAQFISAETEEPAVMRAAADRIITLLGG